MIRGAASRAAAASWSSSALARGAPDVGQGDVLVDQLAGGHAEHTRRGTRSKADTNVGLGRIDIPSARIRPSDAQLLLAIPDQVDTGIR